MKSRVDSIQLNGKEVKLKWSQGQENKLETYNCEFHVASQSEAIAAIKEISKLIDVHPGKMVGTSMYSHADSTHGTVMIDPNTLPHKVKEDIKIEAKKNKPKNAGGKCSIQ